MLVDNKILESERNAVYVKSTDGDRLTGSVVENKNVFDKYPELIKEKFNALVDMLISLGLDTVVNDFADRYTISQTDELVEAETNTLVEDVSIDLTTGAITITKKDGTFKTIDTALEKVPASFEIVKNDEDKRTYLKVTNLDGSYTQTDVTNLIKNVGFRSSATITIAVTPANADNDWTNIYAFKLGKKSIETKHLADEVMQPLDEAISKTTENKTIVEAAKAEVLDASQIVTDNRVATDEARMEAENNMLLSKSYAIGDTGTRVGEETNNARYYCNEAIKARNDAQAHAERADILQKEANTYSTLAIQNASEARDSATEAKASETNATASEEAAVATKDEILAIRESIVDDVIEALPKWNGGTY